MKVSVLGCGAYGIALSMMVNRNNHDITMWTKFEDEKKMLEKYPRLSYLYIKSCCNYCESQEKQANLKVVK